MTAYRPVMRAATVVQVLQDLFYIYLYFANQAAQYTRLQIYR